ncbi:MAG: hypothetical protein DMD94_07475 [Candidatus Rokuibacteriota bacterium]|nr:MAG: hypothetical protein DMD94_07475 [Candidatus Rokubacteria bacterium]
MVPKPTEIGEALERFLRSAFSIREGDSGFDRDAQLYDSGFVDSAGVVELIDFLESTFDVGLQDDDVFSDEFTTINGISAIVHQRLATRVSPDEATGTDAARVAPPDR